MKGIALMLLVLATLLAAGTAAAATSLKGTWVATGPSGKMTLKLVGAGTAYHGTLTTVNGGKRTVARVTGRFDDADGARQLTLTFASTHHSSMCGLVGTRLYCQLGSGTATFTRP